MKIVEGLLRLASYKPRVTPGTIQHTGACSSLCIPRGAAGTVMSVWQPIDTAPDEEGSRALLFDGKDQFVGVLTRYNRHGQWRLWTGDRPSPWDGQKPTHWMPLTEPPENTEQPDARPEPGAAAAEPTPGEALK